METCYRSGGNAWAIWLGSEHGRTLGNSQSSDGAKHREGRQMKYKVAIKGNRWKYGFTTLEQAIAYEKGLREKDGIFRAIVAYKADQR